MEKSEIDLFVEQICAEKDPSKIKELAAKLAEAVDAKHVRTSDAPTEKETQGTLKRFKLLGDDPADAARGVAARGQPWRTGPPILH